MATSATQLLLPLPPVRHRVDLARPTPGGSAWWLLHAPVGRERSCAEAIAREDVGVLCPLVEYRRRTPNGTPKRRIGALFDGYIFICGDEFDRLTALRAVAGRGCYTIPVLDTERLVSDLSGVLAAIEAGCPLGLVASELVPGDRVRVTAGLLEGRTGVYTRSGRAGHLWIEVACLGRSVPVEVEDWQVEPIKEQRGEHQ